MKWSIVRLGLDLDGTSLLLNIEHPGTPLRGLGDADEVEYSSEDQQNYERLARLLVGGRAQR